jgi:Xaa-Pro aminopeptidase
MKPLLLLSRGDADADFIYATGFAVESAIYLKFDGHEDLLAVGALELERARQESRVKQVVDVRDAGLEKGSADVDAALARLAARLLRERGHEEVRVAPMLPAAWYEEIRKAGVGPEIELGLFLDQRRRKSAEEASFIHAAQRAAEAACAAVMAVLTQANVRDGQLWLEGEPLTSERLKVEAESALTGIGYAAGDLIIAGAPGNAMGHYRGEGPLKAGAPIVMDIFPRGRTSHYHGDLTRTVVVGEVSDELRRMHDACCDALDAAIDMLKEGVNGKDVHRAACTILLGRGYGATTEGFEGDPKRPRMNHSLGHGVGLEIHEAPYLRDLDYPLVSGDVVTVEPGLYLNGFGGLRVEDTGMVTKDGFKNFTTLTRSLEPQDYL